MVLPKLGDTRPTCHNCLMLVNQDGFLAYNFFFQQQNVQLDTRNCPTTCYYDFNLRKKMYYLYY